MTNAIYKTRPTPAARCGLCNDRTAHAHGAVITDRTGGVEIHLCTPCRTDLEGSACSGCGQLTVDHELIPYDEIGESTAPRWLCSSCKREARR